MTHDSLQSSKLQAAGRPIEIDREMAMAEFGVTYVHAGSYADPILEIIGRHGPETLPDRSDGIFFTKEADAIRYVRELARRHAERELALASTKRFGDRIQLLMALQFPFLRKRYGAAVVITQINRDRRTRARRLLSEGFTPVIERLPDMLRLPAVLATGATVFSVDASHPLTVPPRIEERQIASRHAIPASGAPFDAVLRYKITETPGLAAFDTVSRTERQFQRYPDGIEVFLTRKAAEEFLDGICRRVQRSLSAMRLSIAGRDAAPALSNDATVLALGVLDHADECAISGQRHPPARQGASARSRVR